jgi:hypothetical protein
MLNCKVKRGKKLCNYKINKEGFGSAAAPSVYAPRKHGSLPYKRAVLAGLRAVHRRSG